MDTNVLAAGLLSRNGASFAVLGHVAEMRLRPLVTTALFLEYEAVLHRPEHRAAHGLSNVDIDRFLAGLAGLAEAVEVHFRWRPQLSDPKDEMVLEAAVNGRADALVTHNVRDFQKVSERFELQVIRPAELLQGLRR